MFSRCHGRRHGRHGSSHTAVLHSFHWSSNSNCIMYIYISLSSLLHFFLFSIQRLVPIPVTRLQRSLPSKSPTVLDSSFEPPRSFVLPPPSPPRPDVVPLGPFQFSPPSIVPTFGWHDTHHPNPSPPLQVTNNRSNVRIKGNSALLRRKVIRNWDEKHKS